ncbi:MAG TPA: extracellular solute-binding protein, partial [Chloroflexia bacterium]|nr:extracellular solute-binding protein [Chloroflexia bacterium]
MPQSGPPPRLRATILGAAALAIGGSLLAAGTSVAWIMSASSLLAVAALAGVGLAVAGALRLWRIGTALDDLASALIRDENILLFQDVPLPADVSLAPLIGALLGMSRFLRELIMQLQMQADQVRDAALHIGQAAMRHEQDAAAQAAAVSQVAAALQELEAIIAHVTETAHGVARAAEHVLHASTTSREVIGSAAGAIGATGDRVGETIDAITTLRAQAAQIGAISAIIAQIADETHILALNAAIEAAGAGPVGRRFAVVAGEVRTLAERTRREGQQVTSLVEELEQALVLSTQAAEAGLQQTRNTTELTTHLTNTAEQLTVTAERTQQRAATIDQAMTQQRISAAEVGRALTQILDAARSMNTQFHAMVTEADDLIGVAEHVRGLALRFGVRQASGAAVRLLIAGRETVSDRARAWKGLVDSWNLEHPATPIALEFLPPSADYDAELGRALAAGTAPDIVQVQRGTGWGRQGYLAPLDALLSPAVRADFYPALLESASVDGQLYSLPTEAQPFLIYYNRRLFDDLGLAVPQTWEAWIATARRCRTATRAGLMLNTLPSKDRARQWLPFIWQGAGLLPAPSGPGLLEAAAAQQAVGLWRDLLVTHQVAPARLPHPWYDIANLAEGHCAMQYLGSWGLVMLRKSYPEFPYGVMDLPIPAGGQRANILFRWGLAVNTHSRQRDIACGFVQWALAGDGHAGSQRVRSLMIEGLPVRQSVVPLVEQEGAVDSAWRFMLDQVLPHARPDN